MNPIVFRNAANEVVLVHAPYILIGKENGKELCLMTSAHLDIDGRDKNAVSTVTEPHLIPNVTMDEFIEHFGHLSKVETDVSSSNVHVSHTHRIIDLRPIQLRRERAALAEPKR